jgi:hypothetical protein
MITARGGGAAAGRRSRSRTGEPQQDGGAAAGRRSRGRAGSRGGTAEPLPAARAARYLRPVTGAVVGPSHGEGPVPLTLCVTTDARDGRSHKCPCGQDVTRSALAGALALPAGWEAAARRIPGASRRACGPMRHLPRNRWRACAAPPRIERADAADAPKRAGAPGAMRRSPRGGGRLLRVGCLRGWSGRACLVVAVHFRRAPRRRRPGLQSADLHVLRLTATPGNQSAAAISAKRAGPCILDVHPDEAMRRASQAPGWLRPGSPNPFKRPLTSPGGIRFRDRSSTRTGIAAAGRGSGRRTP